LTRRIAPLLLVLCAAAPTAIFAQSTQPKLRFEVVSIKPLEHFVRYQRPSVDPGRASYPGVLLKVLILLAYDLQYFEVNGGPAWVDEQSYDVLAKLPDGATEKQVPAMLQSMLSDRFGLKVHWESPMERAYTLVVGRNGLKLKKLEEPAPPGAKPPGTSISPTVGHLEFRRQTMAQFAKALSQDLGHQVIDMTGIEGTFDIVMDVNPSELEGQQKLAKSEVFETTSAPSIFTVVQELGLRLERRTAPVPHLVIDHVERIPTEN
jgi:uncharacterized protein (TIGR03435 family)